MAMDRPDKQKYLLPLAQFPLLLKHVLTPARAGFPSPADDYLEGKLDLNQLLIRHPAATYIFRVEGDSMTTERIYDGDLLIVDTAITPKSGDIILAVLDGGFVVKRMIRRDGHILLMATEGDFPPILVKPERDFQVWGKVTYAIHKL
jgi:DNA polymerase V